MLPLGMGTPGPGKGWQGLRVSRPTLSPTYCLEPDIPNPLPWAHGVSGPESPTGSRGHQHSVRELESGGGCMGHGWGSVCSLQRLVLSETLALRPITLASLNFWPMKR